jgi:hypothetical protein
MALPSELPLQSGDEPVVERIAKGLSRRDESFVIRTERDLHVANVTAAVSLGIQVGEACLRQILRGTSGPLGKRT